ncbi:hypothetical protein T484DRAFT_2020914, partial [Baffinella frigidus]
MDDSHTSSRSFPCALMALAEVVDAAMGEGSAKVVEIDVALPERDGEGDASSEPTMLWVQGDYPPAPVNAWRETLAAGLLGIGNGSRTGQENLLPPHAGVAGALMRLAPDALLLLRQADSTHAILLSRRMLEDSPPAAPTLATWAVSGAEAEAHREKANAVLQYTPFETLEQMSAEAAKLPPEGIRFILFNRTLDGLQPLKGWVALPDGGDLRLAGPVVLFRGYFALHGEARGQDGCVYASDMHLRLQDQGSVTGAERGLLLPESEGSDGPAEVSGKIRGGCWRRDGLMELEYLFQDGAVFLYRGKVDAESRTFTGEWFDEKEGWEGSANNNRGTFSLEMRRVGENLPDESCRQHYASSTKAFLEVLHKGRRAEVRLRENRVKRRSLMAAMALPVAYECAPAGQGQGQGHGQGQGQGQGAGGKVGGAWGSISITIGCFDAALADAGADVAPAMSGFFVYRNKRLLLPCLPLPMPSTVLGATPALRASGVFGVVEADSLPLAVGPKRLGITLEAWGHLEEAFQERLLEYLKQRGDGAVVPPAAPAPSGVALPLVVADASAPSRVGADASPADAAPLADAKKQDGAAGRTGAKHFLTAEQAQQIYAQHPGSSDVSFKQMSLHLGEQFRVDSKTVRDIWNHTTWGSATRHLWGEVAARHVARVEAEARSGEREYRQCVSNQGLPGPNCKANAAPGKLLCARHEEKKAQQKVAERRQAVAATRVEVGLLVWVADVEGDHCPLALLAHAHAHAPPAPASSARAGAVAGMPSVVTWWPPAVRCAPPPEPPARPRSFCWDGSAAVALPSGPAGSALLAVVPERLEGPATSGAVAGVVVRALCGVGWWLVECGEAGRMVEVACLGENLSAREEGEKNRGGGGGGRGEAKGRRATGKRAWAGKHPPVAARPAKRLDGRSAEARNSLQGRCRSVLTRLLKSEFAVLLENTSSAEEEDDEGGSKGGLRALEQRLEASTYHSMLDFRGDVLQVWRDCLDTHGPDSEQYGAVVTLASDFDNMFLETFSSHLLRMASDLHAENEMECFGLRVCTLRPSHHTQRFGMIDDIEDGRAHIIYDDEEEEWLPLPDPHVLFLHPDVELYPAATVDDAGRAGGGGGEEEEGSGGDDEDEGDEEDEEEVDAGDAGDEDYEEEEEEDREELRAVPAAVPATRAPPSEDARPVQRGSSSGASAQQHSRERRAPPPGPAEFKVGTLVEVLFDEGGWYPGKISKFHSHSGEHRISFDDGDFQDIRLPDPDVRYPKNGPSFRDLAGSAPAIKHLPGDFVWWAFRKGEWWPALVADLNQIKADKLRTHLEDEGQPDEDSVLVYTFGDRHFSWVDLPPSDLIGFGLHMRQLLQQQVSSQDQFRISCNDAVAQWKRLGGDVHAEQTARYSGREVAELLEEEQHQELQMQQHTAAHARVPDAGPLGEGEEAGEQERGGGQEMLGRASSDGSASSSVLGGEGAWGGGKHASSAEDPRSRREAAGDEEMVGGWRIAKAEEEARRTGEAAARLARIQEAVARIPARSLRALLATLGVAMSPGQVDTIVEGALGFGKPPGDVTDAAGEGARQTSPERLSAVVLPPAEPSAELPRLDASQGGALAVATLGEGQGGSTEGGAGGFGGGEAGADVGGGDGTAGEAGDGGGGVSGGGASSG